MMEIAMQPLRQVLDCLMDAGGQVYFVGGCVRDYLLGRPLTDIDIEIFHLTPMQLEGCLSRFGHCDFVGKSFGIYKLSHLPQADFALPRQEVKASCGHQGFDIKIDPFLSIEKASARRDFTMNAVYYHLNTKQFIDLHGGMEDIKHHRIVHIDDRTFIEDPLRVYRLAQFMSRLQFDCDPKTKELCVKMVQSGELQKLSKERIKAEYDKLLMGVKPSLGLQFLDDLGILIPAVSNLKLCHQRPDYHPEGNAYIHTLMVVDAASQRKEKTSNPLGFMWGALLHDIGKLKTTDDFGHAYGHETVGSEMAKSVLLGLDNNKKQQAYIVALVRYHMQLMGYVHQHIKDKTYLKFLKRLEPQLCLQDLYYMSQSDMLGTGRDVKEDLALLEAWMADYPIRLGDRAPSPLVVGRDLIDLGMKPGPTFKQCLDEAYDLQLGGMKKEGILKVLRREVAHGEK